MSKGMVYVVDDEEPIRRSLKLLLRTTGWDAALFESGDTFLDAVDTLRPGCILLDVRMPGMDGAAVQQELRRRGTKMPVIVMTGHGDLSVAVAALQGGAIDFVEKPFERMRLTDALGRAQLWLFDTASYHSLGRDAVMAIARLHVVDRRVLDAFAQGMSNQAVSAALGMTVPEVEISRARMVERLGGQNLSDAIRTIFLARSVEEAADS